MNASNKKTLVLGGGKLHYLVSQRDELSLEYDIMFSYGATSSDKN